MVVPGASSTTALPPLPLPRTASLIRRLGYGHLLFSSGVKSLFALHLAGGYWTVLFLKHLGQIGAAGPLARFTHIPSFVGSK